MGRLACCGVWAALFAVVNVVRADATLAADALPTAAAVVSDGGQDLTARAGLRIKDGKVRICFARGVVVLVR